MSTNSDPKLTRLQRVQFEVLWFLCCGFARLPHWIRYYVIGEIIFFVLYYCLRYRMKVVTENLHNSFPEKSEKELFTIRRNFYKTLADVFVDTVSITGVSEQKVHKFMSIKNIDRFEALTEGRDWIGLMAHYGCWEYMMFLPYYHPEKVLMGVYHPLRNRVMDAFYLRLRGRKNVCVVSMNETMRFYLRNCKEGVEGKRIGLGLIADQNPPRRPDSHWFRFLNQDTIFFDGGEKLALRFGLPVFYVQMNQLRRGYYEFTLEPIYDGKEPVEPNEITERYVRHLERNIMQRPEQWMWSHRRWKHKRDVV